MKFDIHHRHGLARTGEIRFRRGVVRTPAFMPVGTYGTVKSVTPEEVAADGADIILVKRGLEQMQVNYGALGFTFDNRLAAMAAEMEKEK